jgi:hypothetical protein
MSGLDKEWDFVEATLGAAREMCEQLIRREAEQKLRLEVHMRDEAALRTERDYYRDMWKAQRAENEQFRKQLGLVAVSELDK